MDSETVDHIFQEMKTAFKEHANPESFDLQKHDYGWSPPFYRITISFSPREDLPNYMMHICEDEVYACKNPEKRKRLVDTHIKRYLKSKEERLSRDRNNIV